MSQSNLGNSYTETWKIDLPAEASFFYRNDSSFLISDFGPRILTHNVFECVWTSQDVVIVGDVESSRYKLYGAITADRSLTHFLVHRNQGRFFTVTACQPEIAPHQKGEDIVLLEGDDWRQLLIQYADLAAERAGYSVPQNKSNVTGYCSWYYYYHNVTEKQFLESVQALAEHTDTYPVKYVQIDDGYQTAHGDWLSRNRNWPSPLKDIVKRVNEMGFEAGIWSMPFLASLSSEIFKKHPDWFVKDANGQPWYVRGWSPEPHHNWACLDLTNDEVKKHLKETFEQLHEYGFRYFKFDGGGFSAPQGIRKDPSATGFSCLREGLQILRQTLADSVILGCGIPFLPSIGLVDHTRVSTDTNKCWQAWGLPTDDESEFDSSRPCDPATPCLDNALKQTLANWWKFDRWFRCDPDTVMARDENTNLTAAEARASALSAIVTGIAITSDRLDRLSDQRLKLLGRAAKIRMHDAKPVDWQKCPWPHVFSGTVEGKDAVAIFNFSQATQQWNLCDLGLPQNAGEILHPLGQIKETIKLQPHDAALILGSC